MWSARIARALVALGHTQQTFAALPTTVPDADLAIVNLGSESLPAKKLVPVLHEKGIFVVAHAGHKEKNLLEEGREVECNLVVSNSVIANKLAELIEQVKMRDVGAKAPKLMDS